MAERLRNQATAAGVSHSVAFRGHVAPFEVAALLDRSTCLVLPSRSEGLPRIAVEAMARGRAVVGSRGGGIPDIVDDGATGVLVPVDDEAALADALVSVLSDPMLAARLGREGRARAEAMDPAREFAQGVERLAAWVAGGSPR
jgi:starch synthase